MAVFTAIATVVTAAAAAAGTSVLGYVAMFAARTLLTIGISRLLAKRVGGQQGAQNAGARVQLPPATNNKIPVVYGKAYIAPIITDAKISKDQKYMWYVCSLAEVTSGSGYTFGDIYYDGKKVIFDNVDNSKVKQLETNSDPIQIDDKVNGKIRIWKFPNGSSSGISTGGANAITIMSDASTGGGIPANLRWNSSLYTSGGQSASMTNLCFMIVRVEYNQDAGTVGLGSLNIELTNSLTQPGEVLLDYMQNTVYGCAIPLDSIDTASLANLDVYSNELIPFTDVNGNPTTQARYRINGPVNTGVDCLTSLQELVDACDSWLQYSELTGEWRIVINREWNWVLSGPPPAITTLYQVTNNNLIGGINVNPIDLNNAYNQLEVQYPNKNIRDQTDFRVIDLIDYVPEVISVNEPENILIVQLPQVNNYIQSLYLGIRRLLQSREDLIIDFYLDYSGIQIDAGDVIAVKAEQYGWDTQNSGYGKLFRVSQVQEAKLEDGSLGARITAFEYNELVYADNALVDFVPEANTGLTDPNIISPPTVPVVTTIPATDNSTASFTVSSNVSAEGTVLYMDFNYGNSSNVLQHVRYTTVNPAEGGPWVPNTTVTISVSDLPAGNLYWSSTARNDMTGTTSNASTQYVWVGPSVNPPTGNTGGITGNVIQANTIVYDNLNVSIATADNLTDYVWYINNPVSNVVLNPIDIANIGANIKLEYLYSNFEQPKYMTGVYSGGGGFFPPYTGNSATSDGYLQNSTGLFSPAQASSLIIENGDLNWQVTDFIYLGPNTVPAGQGLEYDYKAFVVANANVTMQVAPFITVDTSLLSCIADAKGFQTIELVANQPTEILGNNIYTSSGTIDGMGVLVRNFTTSANILFYGATLNLARKRL